MIPTRHSRPSFSLLLCVLARYVAAADGARPRTASSRAKKGTSYKITAKKNPIWTNRRSLP